MNMPIPSKPRKWHNPIRLPCHFAGCQRWFRNQTGLTAHQRAMHAHPLVLQFTNQPSGSQDNPLTNSPRSPMLRAPHGVNSSPTSIDSTIGKDHSEEPFCVTNSHSLAIHEDAALPQHGREDLSHPQAATTHINSSHFSTPPYLDIWDARSLATPQDNDGDLFSYPATPNYPYTLTMSTAHGDSERPMSTLPTLSTARAGIDSSPFPNTPNPGSLYTPHGDAKHTLSTPSTRLTFTHVSNQIDSSPYPHTENSVSAHAPENYSVQPPSTPTPSIAHAGIDSIPSSPYTPQGNTERTLSTPSTQLTFAHIRSQIDSSPRSHAENPGNLHTQEHYGEHPPSTPTPSTAHVGIDSSPFPNTENPGGSYTPPILSMPPTHNSSLHLDVKTPENPSLRSNNWDDFNLATPSRSSPHLDVETPENPSPRSNSWDDFNLATPGRSSRSSRSPPLTLAGSDDNGHTPSSVHQDQPAVDREPPQQASFSTLYHPSMNGA